MNYARWGRNLDVILARLGMDAIRPADGYRVVMQLSDDPLVSSVSQATAVLAVLATASTLKLTSWPDYDEDLYSAAVVLFRQRIAARRILDGSLQGDHEHFKAAFDPVPQEHIAVLKKALGSYQSLLRDLEYPDNFKDPNSPCFLD